MLPASPLPSVLAGIRELLFSANWWVLRVMLLGWVACPVGAIAVEIVLLFKLMILALGAIILPAFPCPAVSASIFD